jgi:flagellar biosynthesis/type III secretory pathway M-ring protein FliF/YscJ
MSDDQKKQFILVGALLAVVIAVAVIVTTMSKPAETVNRYEDVPKKGAGKFEKD